MINFEKGVLKFLSDEFEEYMDVEIKKYQDTPEFKKLKKSREELIQKCPKLDEIIQGMPTCLEKEDTEAVNSFINSIWWQSSLEKQICYLKGMADMFEQLKNIDAFNSNQE